MSSDSRLSPYDEPVPQGNDPLRLGPSRGGCRRPEAPSYRELTPADLPHLSENRPSTQLIRRLRAPHHQLAQALAQGASPAEAALLTGYDPSYISRIASEDPSFKELIAHYSSVVEAKFADTIERMRQLGLSSLEELQDRLESNPDDWTKRELMELAELTLVKPQRVGGAALTPTSPPGASAVAIQVNFVSPGDTAKLIEVKKE